MKELIERSTRDAVVKPIIEVLGKPPQEAFLTNPGLAWI
jgi:hypothetical protein